MAEMTARQPRRTRRRIAPPGSLPRPASADRPASDDALEGAEDALDTASTAAASPTAARRTAPRHAPPAVREHHVTEDYSYVHKDLYWVAAVGAITLAFIVIMSFIVS
jgi:hypothetical protein